MNNLKNRWNQMIHTNMEYRYSVLILVMTFSYLLYLIMNDKHSWVLHETFFHEYYIKQNVPLHHIFRGIFDARAFEWADRVTRPLSTFFEILDTYLRSWLWQYIKPISSLSITFLFTLLLSPWFFYKFLLKLNIKKNIALLATAFLLLHPGSLSLVVMLFRPAKAMMNFWLIFCLYFSAIIYSRDVSESDRSNTLKLIGLIAFGMFMGFLFDETALIIVVSILIMFPSVFFRDYRRLIIFSLVPLSLLLCYFVIYPNLAVHYGFEKPNLFTYMPFSDPRIPQLKIFISNFLQHLFVIPRESFVLFNPLYFPHSWESVVIGLSFFFMIGFTFTVILHIKDFTKYLFSDFGKLLMRSIFLILILCLIHTILLDLVGNKYTGRIWGPYWYGSYFGVFLALFLALIGEIFMQGKNLSSYMYQGMMTTLCFSLMIAFPYLNFIYRIGHHPIQIQVIEKVFRGELNRFQLYDPKAIPGNDEIKRLWKLFKSNDTPNSMHRMNIWIPIEMKGGIPNAMAVTDP